MEKDTTHQWTKGFYVPKRVNPAYLSFQKPAKAGKPEMRAERHARDGAAAARLKAVNYLNRLNQTQWQKITEYLTAKFSTQSLAKDKAINRVRTKIN